MIPVSHRHDREMVNQDVDELVHVDLALDIAKLTLKQEIGSTSRLVTQMLEYC